MLRTWRWVMFFFDRIPVFMHDELIVKYSVGAGLALLLLLCLFGLQIMAARRRSLTHSIVFHVVQVAFLLGLIGVLRYYAEMAVLDYQLDTVVNHIIDFMSVTAMALIVTRKLFMLVNRLERRQIRKGSDPTSSRIVSRAFKLAVMLIMMLLFGEHFGMSLSGLLAFGGIGGIAIGMASKDILSNFFSGVMLYFDRPFSIGDWVSSPDRNIEGTVVEIGWRMTKIITFSNRPMYVPNSLFATISVENPGRMTNRRINTEIGLRYEDAGRVAGVVEDIRTMLLGNPKIDTTQTVLVYFNQFADSSLNIMVYCFTKTTDWAEWLAAQQEVYLAIIDIVQKHGADFAFPSQTVYLQRQDAAPGPGSA